MNNLKKLTQEELDGIEYSVLSTAMETGATEQEINEAREKKFILASGPMKITEQIL